MSILVSTHARIAVAPGAPFQNIREVVARGREHYDPESPVREKLCASYLRCQKGMQDQSTSQCLACPRLVNFVPQLTSVVVRCLWTDDDRVEDLMTLESEFVAVSPSTSVQDADATAREYGVRHLLVVENGKLYGVLCRCDLEDQGVGGTTVAERANQCPWTITPQTTLSQAAQLMRDRRVGMLPVIAEGELLGVVTRGDLRRAGVSEALVGARRSAA